MLEVSNIDVHYGQAQALFGVNLRLGEGEIACVIGPNGAGKTTLLKAITGIVKITRGEITLGNNISKLPAYERARLGISLVPEGRGLFNHLSVRDNLLIAAYLVRDKQETERRLQNVFAFFPILKEREKQAAGTLSGGEQQMLSIGRALMPQPRVLLLDEPSTGLSPLKVSEVFESIRSLRGKDVSVLIVEQNVFAALSVSDRGYVLDNGKIVTEGTREQLSKDESIKRSYLGIG
jgi:branched-chain amino acid transport system ATP-binding protein